MVKKILLILLLFGQGVNTLRAIQINSALKKVTKKSFYVLGFNEYAIITYAVGRIIAKIKEAIETNPDQFKLLNKDSKYVSVIDELLETYAQGNKEIRIYSPTARSSFSQDDKLKNSDNAEAGPNGRIFVDPLIKKALKNQTHELHLAAKAIIGHEIGHVIHKHGEKQELLLGAIAGTTFYITHKFLNLPITKMKQYNFLKIIPALIVKNLTDRLIFLTYNRKIEREADTHAINYTKDPSILYAQAHWFSQRAEKHKNISTFDKLLSTHPTDQERAETFAQAARKLEEKLKN
ncbi:MAG: M48 family metalloprotease [Candidatus Babeliaceae bacterium]|jgi:Zn-dependent protease with chaperone function